MMRTSCALLVAAVGAAGSSHGDAALPTLAASYRKDYWLPQYIEFLVPDPVFGGRMHIVGAAAASGVPASVFVNGTYLNMTTGLDPSTWAVDWVRTEPQGPGGFVKGAPFWVSFHSRQLAWDEAAATGALTSLLVQDARGNVLVNGSFATAVAPVRVTWVTTASSRSVLHVFLHNDNPAGTNETAVSVVINGVDVTAAVPPSLLRVPGGQSVLWVLPVTLLGGAAAVAPGLVWTAVVQWSNGGVPTVAGGLLFREQYVVETWYHSSDCPFPTVNDSAYNLHRSVLGVDTFFQGYSLDPSCNTSLTGVDLVNTLGPEYGFNILLSGQGDVPLNAVTNDSALAGWFLADEDDTKVDDKARELLATVVTTRAAWPGQPTYAGGASNRYTGAYAGITDIKGMDAYIGACAPHYALLNMPPRGSYDYLANTRANHAPGPTWLYTQGFFDGWKAEQSDPAEAAVQVLSVVAAGAKSVMIFMTQLSFAVGPSAPGFATLATLLREVGALRELYRAGDITGMAAVLNGTGQPITDVIVEATLHPRAVVVTLINAVASNALDYALCCLVLPGNCHFDFVPQNIANLTLALPAGFSIADSFEVFNATVLPGQLGYAASAGAGIYLNEVELGSQGPSTVNCSTPALAVVRTLVFAADTALRGELAANLIPPAPIPAGQARAVPAATRAPAAAQNSTTVTVVRSARDTGDRMTPQPPLSFASSAPPVNSTHNTTLISLNAAATFQTIVGFGGAITESAVYNFGRLDAATADAVIAALYGEDGNGTSLRYTFGRLTIGSCDFALNYYNYNENVGDVNMTQFSIAHDEEAIIPFILRAQATAAQYNRTLRFLSSPWSPPAWMKSNYALIPEISSMSCFPLGPLDCTLVPEYQPAYALYFSRYVSAFKAAGVNIWGVTIQNEPQPQTGTLTYEGMWLDFPAEAQFLGEYLGPQLAADHPDVKIFAFDHNQADAYWYAAPILADPVAGQYASGVAFHWYSGPDWSALAALAAEFPDKMLLASEATAARGTTPGWYESPDWSTGEYYGTFIINDLLVNSVGFIDWNIMLDQNGGPSHADPTGEMCEGLIPCGSDAMLIVDTSATPPVVYKQAFYWYMGQVSAFVPPGSVRIGSNATRPDGSATPILSVAFTLPAGNTAVVIMNPLDTPEDVQLADPRFGVVATTLVPHSIQTWTF